MIASIKPKDLNNIEVMVNVLLNVIESNKHNDIISDELKNDFARFDKSIFKRKITDFMITEFNCHKDLGFSSKKSLKMSTESTIKHWGYQYDSESLACVTLLVLCEYRHKMSSNLTRWLRRYNVGSIVWLILFSLFANTLVLSALSYLPYNIFIASGQMLICLELVFILVLISLALNRVVFIKKFEYFINIQVAFLIIGIIFNMPRLIITVVSHTS